MARRASSTRENKEYLWNIIAIGTLNDSPAIVSAALFVKVLQSAFMGNHDGLIDGDSEGRPQQCSGGWSGRFFEKPEM